MTFRFPIGPYMFWLVPWEVPEQKIGMVGVNGSFGRLPFAISILSQDADDAALNFYIVRGNDDRRHFGISGLETNLAGTFAIEALESGFVAADQRDNNIAGIGDLGLLADYEIAVHELVFEHGTALHFECEGISTVGEVAEGKSFALFDR